MNVIDALFVTLGLDTKDFEKGNKEVDQNLKKLRETADKTAKDMAESGKRAAEMFTSVKVELLGLLATFGAATGLKDFIFGSITSGAALGRLSANLHMSTQRLDAWRTAAEGVGDTAEGVATSLQNIASGLAKSALGDYSYLQTAAKFGINLSGNMTPEQAAMVIGQRMRQLDATGPQGRQYALAVAQSLGIGGMAQTELRSDLNPALDKYEKASGQTPQLIAKQMALQQKVAELKERLRTVSEKLFVKLEPQIEKFANWLENIDWDKVSTNLSNWFDDAQKILNALGGVKGILLDIAAIKVFGWIASVASWVMKLRTLTAALTAARAAAAVPGGVTPAGAVPAAAAAATGGFWSKLFGAGGFLGLLRTAAWAPRPAEDASTTRQNDKAALDKAKRDEATYGGFWGALWHSVTGGGSPTADRGPSVAPRANGTTRPDDDIDLFGGKYSGKAGTAALFSDLEKKNGLPQGLLASVLNAESDGGKYVVSPKGALGPFQFMPGTAAQYGLDQGSVFKLDASANAAARYLHDLLATFHGDLPEALAAYNWGQGNVMRKGMGALPQETQDYIRKVMSGVDLSAGANARSPYSTGNSTSTSQTYIGEITVNTRATDAKGIARDIRQAIADHTLVSQADTGLA